MEPEKNSIPFQQLNVASFLHSSYSADPFSWIHRSAEVFYRSVWFELAYELHINEVWS